MPEDIIKAKIVFDTSGIGGSLGSNAGNKGSGGIGGALGKASKGGKGLLGAGAMAGAVAAGVSALISVVKKGFEAVKKASPRLQATMSIFGRAIMMILRPIGDVISLVLRPLALSLLKWAIPFYKNWKERMNTWFGGKGGEGGAGGNALGEGGEEENFGAIAEAGNVAWNLLKGSLLIVWGVVKAVAAVVLMAAEGWAMLLDKALTPIMPVLTYIGEAFLAFGVFISDIGTALWDLATGGSWDEFLGALVEAWDKFKEALIASVDKMWAKFIDMTNKPAEATRKWMIKLVEGIKTGFKNIVEWIKTTFSSISSWIGSTLDGMFNKIKNVFTSIVSWIVGIFGSKSGGGSGGGRKRDDFVSRPGQAPVSFSPNDTIVGMKDISKFSGGGKGNVTININALDASSISADVLNKITSAVGDAMERGLNSRTTESIGI